MKILLKTQAIKRNNSATCTVIEHSIGDTALDFAVVTLFGRYPEKGQATNQQCKELVYIQEGNGEAVVEGKHYPLSAGDVILIEPGEKFYWQGHMQLFISCRPAWTKDQHHLLD